jgi:hypothetical protein
MPKVRNPRYRGNPWRATRRGRHSQTLATEPAAPLRLGGTHSNDASRSNILTLAAPSLFQEVATLY